jgi:tight adherence protein C
VSGPLVTTALSVLLSAGAAVAVYVAVSRLLRVPLLERLRSVNRRLIAGRYEGLLRRQLTRAALSGRVAPEELLAVQELSALLSLLLGAWLCVQLGASPLWSGGMAAGASAIPLVWLNDQVKRRHQLISRALPYSLDLLTLSVEAGLDLAGALAKVVEKGRSGPLRDELQIVLKQLKMGKTREEALRALAERVDLAALTSFVGSLIQAERMGSGLGKVLRAQSSLLRMDRTLRAEKLAAEAPVKMLFPLIACIFPTVFMILFGPIVFAFLYGGAV